MLPPIATDAAMPRLKLLRAFKVYLPDIEGGIPTFMRQASVGLRDRFASRILVTRRWGTPVELRVDDVRVSRTLSLGDVLSMPVAPFFPLWFWRLAKRADIVVHHAPFPLVDLAIALFFPRRAALVIHWHSEIVAQQRSLGLIRPLIERALRRAERVVVESQPMIDNSPFLRPLREKCRVVPCGVDLAGWNDLNGDDQAAIDALRAQHPRLVIALGRLVPYKGYEVLIRAMQAVDGHCIIVGSGTLRRTLETLIAELGVQSKVTLAGRLPFTQVRRLLHAAGLLCMPSVSAAETFGISQIEAMACGCAIVNTALPTGVPWVARDSQEGLTVAPGDAAGLAEALTALLTDPALRARYGAAARVRVAATFNEAETLAGLAAVYEDAARARGLLQ